MSTVKVKCERTVKLKQTAKCKWVFGDVLAPFHGIHGCKFLNNNLSFLYALNSVLFFNYAKYYTKIPTYVLMVVLGGLRNNLPECLSSVDIFKYFSDFSVHFTS